MPAAGELDFVVQRKDLRHYAIEQGSAQAGTGEALLGIEKFALTSNNITYAVFGDSMKYWDFFPHPHPADWGRIPVWGYAKVLDTQVAGLEKGERLYGYLPMSTHLSVRPERLSAHSFIDGAEHRRALPGAYQQYLRLRADPMHDPRYEDHRALLHPLYFTSFLIEDFIGDHQAFGAAQIVIASASSKTALGLAFLLSKKRPSGVQVIGLTSERNRSFCERLGYYDQVVTYDRLATLPTATPTVFVDMAGDGKLLYGVHHHFHGALKYSCIVGATHWDQRATQHELPGAKPQFFFAPTQMARRLKDWGGEVFGARYGEAWQMFLPSAAAWLEIRRGRGPEAVGAAYLELLEGRTPPQVGHILSLT